MKNFNRRGYGLIELILGLAVMGVVVVAASRTVQQGQDTQMARGIAQRSTEVNAAADAYIRMQIGVIQDALPAVGDRVRIPVVGPGVVSGPVTLPSLQQAGVLGARFQARGAYDQTAVLVIERTPDVVAGTPATPTPIPPATNQMFNYEAYVVYSGGRPIPDRVLGQASSLADGRTGAIMVSSPAGGAAARGFKGGWVIPTADIATFGVADASQAGRMVSYVSASKGLGAELQGKWLSRVNTGDEQDNRMETNINVAGRGLNNVGALTARGFVAPNDNVLTLPSSDYSINVTGNLLVVPDDPQNGSNARVDAPRLVAGRDDTAALGPQATYDALNRVSTATGTKPADPTLDVRKGRALVGDLSADYLNADAILYDTAAGSGNSRSFTVSGSSTRATLRDLLPRFVMKASYVAQDQTIVPKASCASNGDRTGARLYVIQDGSQAAVMPVIDTVATMTTTDVPVVTGVGSDGNGGITVTTGTIALPTALDIVNTAQPSPFRTFAFATDSGSFWTVTVRTQIFTPGVGWRDYNDEGYNRALVQVMCEYT